MRSRSRCPHSPGRPDTRVQPETDPCRQKLSSTQCQARRTSVWGPALADVARFAHGGELGLLPYAAVVSVHRRVQGSMMLPESVDSALALEPPPDAVCIVRTLYVVATEDCTLPVTPHGQVEEGPLVNGSEKSPGGML